MNGIHLLDHGNRQLARNADHSVSCSRALPAPADQATSPELARSRPGKELSLVQSLPRRRWYNVYGGRSKLAWFGQSNADVMKREMEIFDVMTANRDKRSLGRRPGMVTWKSRDDNLPKELTSCSTQTNKVR